MGNDNLFTFLLWDNSGLLIHMCQTKKLICYISPKLIVLELKTCYKYKLQLQIYLSRSDYVHAVYHDPVGNHVIVVW